MKRNLLLLIALFFPWIAFLLLEKPISALAALALQLTFVGWLPGTIWAWTEVKRAYPKKQTVPPPVQTIQDNQENLNQEPTEKQATSASSESKPSNESSQSS